MWSIHIHIHIYIYICAYPITFPWCSHYESPDDFHVGSMAFRLGRSFCHHLVCGHHLHDRHGAPIRDHVPQNHCKRSGVGISTLENRETLCDDLVFLGVSAVFCTFWVMVLFSQSCAWPFGTPAVEFWGCGHLWPFWLDGPGNWLLLEIPVACREVCIFFLLWNRRPNSYGCRIKFTITTLYSVSYVDDTYHVLYYIIYYIIYM